MRHFILTALVLLVASVTTHAESGMPEPYTIHVPDAVLKDLKARLRNTRFPDQIEGTGWDYGTDTKYLKELVGYWANDFDWRKREKQLNAFHHYKANVDGQRIHFIHEKGKKPGSIPVLMMHGWPSSFVQFEKIIPLLTDPAAHGAPDAPSFDVVVVSLPGYGFSDIPTQRGAAVRAMVDRFTKLMTESLGYKRFAVRGSDIGGSVAQQISLIHPDLIIGAHVSGLLRGVPLTGEGPPTAAEQKFMKDMDAWSATELAYANLHAQKPQTLAVGLNDSPAGLAAWIVEKFWKWGDTKGNIESRFTKDELLTNLTIYWVTGTIGSSVRFYADFRREARVTGKVPVPTAVLIATHDMVPPPREVSERMYNVARWNQTERGGHFLEWEEPQLVAEDMRAFFSTLPTR